MRRFLTAARLLTALAAVLVGPSLAAAADDAPPSPAVECTPRAGLPNVLAKLKTPGADVRVAYLGGSITAQEGWRPKSLAFLGTQSTGAKVTQVNAAVGGTGSDLGVFRLRRDVLDYKPDLLFVEFAVNDAGAPPDQIVRCMEGIVRQTWRALPGCDVCFVYTVAENLLPDLQAGRYPRAAATMERVAGHYSIPSIHMGLEVARLAQDGKILFKAPLPRADDEKRGLRDRIVFSPDGVHPFPHGHELYTLSVTRSWPAIAAASADKPAPHDLKGPLAADNFEDAKMVPLDRAAVSPGVVKLDPKGDDLAERFAGRVLALYRAGDPGQSVTFRFKGRYAAVYDVIGPDSGQVRVTVDGGEPAARPRFDGFCTYHRLSTLVVASGLPDGVHTVRIEVDKEKPDKAAVLGRRNERMDDPKRFEGAAFYPAALLVVGDLVAE